MPSLFPWFPHFYLPLFGACRFLQRYQINPLIVFDQFIKLSQYYEANPEKFDKATIVRAVSKSPDGSFGRVISKTYFVMSDEKLEYYSGIPVVSLVTDPDNLFGKDNGIYVAGQQSIDPANSSGYSANFYSTGKEWEREADITYFRNGDLGFTQKMGIRIRGASTRNNQAKSFNLYARSKYGDSKLDYKLIDDNRSAVDGKTIKRYDSFGLRAVTWIDRLRERVVHSSLRDIPALATYDSDRCMLFIDGELWGMYEITEKASDYYIQSNYGVPSENVTLIKNGELEINTLMADTLKEMSAEIASYINRSMAAPLFSAAALILLYLICSTRYFIYKSRERFGGSVRDDTVRASARLTKGKYVFSIAASVLLILGTLAWLIAPNLWMIIENRFESGILIASLFSLPFLIISTLDLFNLTMTKKYRRWLNILNIIFFAVLYGFLVFGLIMMIFT